MGEPCVRPQVCLKYNKCLFIAEFKSKKLFFIVLFGAKKNAKSSQRAELALAERVLIFSLFLAHKSRSLSGSHAIGQYKQPVTACRKPLTINL